MCGRAVCFFGCRCDERIPDGIQLSPVKEVEDIKVQRRELSPAGRSWQWGNTLSKIVRLHDQRLFERAEFDMVESGQGYCWVWW
jgi:hypothetical protein